MAKRLRFDLFPLRNFFRRRYFLAGAILAIAGVAVWLAFGLTLRERQYLPGPLSATHATFGDRCDACHTSFHGVKNAACQECHGKRVHSTFEARTPECRECHVEHRQDEGIGVVSARQCVACHGGLVTKNPQPLLQKAVGSFAAHPQFTPLREGMRDNAAIRFNHQIHLTSKKVVGEKLTCASCHVVDAQGRLMKPLVFEPHCQRCHKQEVSGVGADGREGLPIAIEALHKAPDVIRPDLMAKLVVAAVAHPEIFEAQNSPFPGIRSGPPADVSRSLREYQVKWLERLERELYEPFNDTPPLLEHNKRCFLCHVQGGTRAAGEPPVVVESKIPSRWLTRGEFSHRRHDLLSCKTCHANVEQSSMTAETNLPPRELCQRCHADGSARSAGTSCMLCHLYHDTSKSPARRAEMRKEVSLDALKIE